MVLKGPSFVVAGEAVGSLTTESVEGTSLALQSIDNVHGCDGLPLGMLGVGDCITDDILQEYLQHTTGLFVDESRDTLDTSSPCQSSDCWLGDALDIITQHLPVALSAPLSKTFTSFSSARHDDFSDTMLARH